MSFNHSDALGQPDVNMTRIITRNHVSSISHISSTYQDSNRELGGPAPSLNPRRKVPGLPKADVDDIYMLSRDRYSNLDQDSAFDRYVHDEKILDVFFFGEDGNRYIRRTPINMDSHGRGGGYEIIRVDFRTYKKSYLVRAGDRQELSLIDMPKERLQAPISSHKFESEWRLPAGHNRHILNVPQDILTIILGYVVLAPPAKKLGPDVLTLNDEKRFKWPHYKINIRTGYKNDETFHISTWTDSQSVLLQTSRIDKYGPYTEIQPAFFSVIDASCLRTCTSFYNTGISLLYRNILVFLKNDFATLESHILLRSVSDQPTEWALHNPVYRKPHPEEEIYIEDVARGIADIEIGVDLTKLVGWVYHDSFLRFLFTIRPRNAAHLRNLRFRGAVGLRRPVTTGYGFSDTPQDNFVENLRIYAQFISKFCTGLQSLVIEIESEGVPRGQGFLTSFLMSNVSGMDDAPEEALKPILENELRQIESLSELVVVDVKGKHLLWAKPAVKWFKERALNRARTLKADGFSEATEQF